MSTAEETLEEAFERHIGTLENEVWDAWEGMELWCSRLALCALVLGLLAVVATILVFGDVPYYQKHLAALLNLGVAAVGFRCSQHYERAKERHRCAINELNALLIWSAETDIREWARERERA